MSDVITLDLNEVADEWDERLDDDGVDDDEFTKYADLCDHFRLSPIEPARLRWLARQGITLVREDTFEEYAREMAEDIHGDGARELSTYINWHDYADAVRQDYIELSFDGHEWLRRA